MCAFDKNCSFKEMVLKWLAANTNQLGSMIALLVYRFPLSKK